MNVPDIKDVSSFGMLSLAFISLAVFLAKVMVPRFFSIIDDQKAQLREMSAKHDRLWEQHLEVGRSVINELRGLRTDQATGFDKLMNGQSATLESLKRAFEERQR